MKRKIKNNKVLPRMNIIIGATTKKANKIKLKPVKLEKNTQYNIAVDFGRINNRPIGYLKKTNYSWKDKVRMFFGKKPQDEMTCIIEITNP